LHEAAPQGAIISDGTFLYGTTSGEGQGIQGLGSIFKIKPDGTDYTTLINFNGANGSNPRCSLVSDGTFLYGTTNGFSLYGNGNIFKIKPDGTSFDTLMSFNGTNGWHPDGSLFYDGTFLYGTTYGGGTTEGALGKGVIFKIKPDGTAFDTLMTFNDTNGGSPWGSFISDGTFLYGMTSRGGINENGVLFKIKPDGTYYTKLLDFDSINGRGPIGSLFSDGTFLYGTTIYGGSHNYGTLFKYQYCTNNCCFVNYTKAYDTLQNTFVLTVDAPSPAYYHWDFGDNSTSKFENPVHMYTKDTTYNVCLKITTASGDTCSYCHLIGKDHNGNIYRTSGFTIKVVNPYLQPLQTGIEKSLQNENISIFPNPSSGHLTISLPKGEGTVIVCNVLGEKVYLSAIASPQTDIDLSAQSNGVYFINLQTQTKEGSVNKKILISK
jgi:uncharacterized repeat protein (TIGR03803 family)